MASITTTEESVYQRYAEAAREREQSLCCPVTYDARYLERLPREIIERDYGCGDPTAYIRPGDTVLDLGSGGGKVCYIAAQVVGASGRVIGVDCNPEMLALARKYRDPMAAQLGYDNVEFHNGLIQDLSLDLDRLGRELTARPVGDAQSWLAMRQVEDRLRREEPMIADDSVDCIVSNCVLNLVRREDRRQLFSEMFRVLKRRGRVAVSDIVCDEDVPDELQQDPELWSGCISGAFREDAFLSALGEAGFHGITIAVRQGEPWQTVHGIEFRSVTVLAYKGKQGPCRERNQAVVYKGPFRKVEDDDGHTYFRGERMAVCDKTFQLLRQEPYEGMFEAIAPRVDIPLEEAAEFDCRRSVRRHPRETKGLDYDATTAPVSECCDGDQPCC